MAQPPAPGFAQGSKMYLTAPVDHVTVNTSVSPALSTDYYETQASMRRNTGTWFLNVSRNAGITSGKTWNFTSTWNIGGMVFTFHLQLTGTTGGSDMQAKLDVQCCGMVHSSDWFSDTGHDQTLNVHMPCVNGYTLVYAVHIRQQLVGFRDDILIDVNAIDQLPDQNCEVVCENETGSDVPWTEAQKRDARPWKGMRSTDGKAEGTVATRRSDPGAEPVEPIVPPYSAVCKIYFRSDGMGYFGSGVLVSDQVVLTAAHNLLEFDKDGSPVRSTDVEIHFENDPEAYRPVRRWYIQGYVRERDYAFDVAALRLTTSARSNSPVPIACFMDVQHATWDAVGYPAAPDPPFDGQRMWHAIGHFHGLAEGIMSMTHNPMGSGASGGPWLLGQGRDAFVNGVASQSWDDEFDIKTASYFGKGVFNIAWLSRRDRRP